MSTTFSNAVNELNKLFNDYWKANTTSICGYVPEIRWNGIEKADAPDSSKFWCFHSVLNADEEQKTLSVSVGLPGQKRYESYGIIIVQLYCPKSILNSKDKGRQLATVAKNCYRGKQTSGGVWLKNVRIIDVDPEELCYRFNIIADYSFDEIF